VIDSAFIKKKTTKIRKKKEKQIKSALVDKKVFTFFIQLWCKWFKKLN